MKLGRDLGWQSAKLNSSSCQLWSSQVTSTRNVIFTPGPVLGGNTPYGCNQRNGCNVRTSASGSCASLGMRYQKAHECQHWPTQLLNGNASSEQNVCSSTNALVRLGAPG